MKVYVVYWWDHWDNTECDRRYFFESRESYAILRKE